MKRLAVCLAILACVSMTTGCVSRAIKEGIGVARGAKGISVMVKPVSADASARPLGGYTRFVVEPFKDATGSGVPQVIKSTLSTYVAQMLAEHKIPNEPRGKTLTIRGTYVYYEDANNTTDQVFGPFEELLARVQLCDGGRVIGEADCVGRTTESVNKGAEKKAQGLAKAIVDWIDKSYPERP